MQVTFTLEPEDVVSARALAVGVRPRLELFGFIVAVSLMLAASVSPWRNASLPLLIGLTASVAAFRVIQIGRLRESSLAAYARNPTLKFPITASWNGDGLSVRPRAATAEQIPWRDISAVRHNERIVLFMQASGNLHALPKRAFSDAQTLAALLDLARKASAQNRRRRR